MTATPLLLHVFPTFDQGGAQTRFTKLANHFANRLRHVVVSLDGHYGAMESLGRDVNVKTEDVFVSKGSLLRNIRTFRRCLSDVRPDILVTHNWGSIEWVMACTGAGLRHTHIEDGFGPDEAGSQKQRRIWARRLFLSRSEVVVPSLTLRAIAEKSWKIPAGRLHYIPNGVNVSRFARPPESRDPNQPITIGTVAALRAEKNLPRLLRVFSQLLKHSPATLVIVGEGSERSALQALAEELAITDKVKFMGHVADPSALYGTFDIFALTSDTEQMPYTVLEAMAASCPIVATDVGDICHMVCIENRPFVVKPLDDLLLGALLKLQADPKTRRALGAVNARRATETYSEEAMFTAFADLYGIAGTTA